MKAADYVLLLFLVLAGATIAGAATLPDSCGSDKVKFEVTTKKGRPAPSAPATGKAQVIFVETFEQNEGFCVHCEVTTRVGMDGAWVGANRGNSYFDLTTSPGEHHVCVDWQSVLGKRAQKVGLTTLNAEAGKVYYYRIKVKIVESSVGEGMVAEDDSLELLPLDADEGKYLVQISPFSKAQPTQ